MKALSVSGYTCGVLCDRRGVRIMKFIGLVLYVTLIAAAVLAGGEFLAKRWAAQPKVDTTRMSWHDVERVIVANHADTVAHGRYGRYPSNEHAREACLLRASAR